MAEMLGHYAQRAMAFIAEGLMLKLMREHRNLQQQQTCQQQKCQSPAPVEPQIHVKMADPLLHCV